MSDGNTRRRLILSAAVLILGIVALRQTTFSYLPNSQAPELRVELRLPGADNLEQLTDKVVVPIEAAIRSIGGVQEIVGSIRSNGATLRVRLEPGTDVESKAARLESELTVLRSQQLPERSSLVVTAGQLSFDMNLVLWLGADSEASVSQLSVERLRAGLEALPSIRRVTLLGEEQYTLSVTPRTPDLSTADLRAVIHRTLHGHRFGESRGGEHRSLLLEGPLTTSIGEMPVQTLGRSSVLPLQSLAELDWQPEEPKQKARLNGQSGQALFVYGETGTTPIETRREVDAYLRRADLADSAQIVFDRSIPLRTLLRRVAWALLLGTLLCFTLATWLGSLAAGLSWGLVLPLAAASGLNVLLLTDQGLDITTLPVFVLALSAAPMFYAFRATVSYNRNSPPSSMPLLPAGVVVPRRHMPANSKSQNTVHLLTVTAAAGTLLVSSKLLGGEIGPLLGAPARVLLVVALAAALAALVPPTIQLKRQRLAETVGAFSLRQGWAIVLSAAAFGYFAFALAGKTLEPSVGSLSPPDVDLVVDANFGDATTLAEAETRIAAMEQHIQGLEQVESSWSEWQRGRGSVMVEVKSEARQRKLLRVLARQLEFQLASVPGAITVRALSRQGAAGGTVDLSGRLGSIPETDEGALVYRFLLKSTRLKDLLEARALIVQKFAQQGIRPSEILSDWGTAQPSLRLEPKADRRPEEIDQGIAVLSQATRFDPATLFPGEKTLGYRVVSQIGPQNEHELRDSSILEAALPVSPTGSSASPTNALSPAALFTVSRTTAHPSVLREDGRFVMPLTVRMRWAPPRRQETRGWMHNTLKTLTVPSSIDIERPLYHRWAFTKRRLEILRSFAVLPLLLFVIAAIRTNSLLSGTMIMAAPCLAVAGTLIVLQAAATTATELTFLTLGSSLALTMPMAIMMAGAALKNPETSFNLAQFHRFVASSGPTLVLAAVIASLIPFAVQVGVQADIHPWVLPMRAAAASTALGLASALVVVPLLVLGRNRLTRYDRLTAQGHARPQLWTSQDREPRLTVNNLSKVYPSQLRSATETDPKARLRETGFHALQQVNFDLEPGIVGLLGPNGAGKTTLLRILCGLLEPTRGRVLFHDTEVRALNLAHYRHHVGFLPQGFNAYENTTAKAFLDYWALERGLLDRSVRLKELDRVLELVGLSADRDRNVRDFSGGMKRRIGIARALLGDPPILIVDEPTTGLDVESRDRLRSSLLAVAERRIVVFSTHIASDIAAAARRILILGEGQLLFDGSARALIEKGRGRVFELLVTDDQLRAASLQYQVTTRVRTPRGVRLHLVLAPGQAAPVGATAREPSVEEAYLAVMASDEPLAHSVSHSRTLGQQLPEGYGHLLDLTDI